MFEHFDEEDDGSVDVWEFVAITVAALLVFVWLVGLVWLARFNKELDEIKPTPFNKEYRIEWDGRTYRV